MGASANGQWAGLNMGTVKNISCIKFRPRNGEGKRMIGGKFQVSNNADFTNPITLYTIPSNGALEFKDYYITSAIAGGVSAQYVRYLSPDNGYGNVAEITVYTTDTVIVSDFSAATTCSGDAKPVIGASILGSVGSFNNGSSTIDKVFDNNNDTFFDGASANGQWAGLNLGTVKNISCIKFRPRNGEGKRMIGGKFQVSNNADFTNPITLYTIPSNGALEFKDYYITSAIAGGVSAQYVRYLSPDNGYGNIAEITVYTTDTVIVSDFSAATTCSGDAKPVIGASILGSVGSFNNGSSTIDKVFDNNNDTFFDGASANGQWAGLNLGTVKNISCIKFRPRNGEGKRMIGG
jgi:hypothetical protein